MTMPSHMFPPGNGVMHAAASMRTIAAGVNYSCLAALLSVVLDYADTVRDENRYIWTPLRISWLRIDQPKMTYLASRYLSIVFQLFIFTTSFVSDREGSNGNVPVHICRRRYTLLTFAAYIINVIGNANLMQRAYILNMRSRRVLLLFSVLVMAEYGTAAVLGTNTMKMFVFDRRCNATNVPWTIFIAMTPKIFLQGAIWVLTYSKLERGSEALRGNNKFDGGKWTWFMFHGLTMIFIPLAFTRQCVRPDLVFSWPITIMSIGTCRLVLSSEKIKHDLMWKQSQRTRPMSPRRPSASMPAASVDANSYDNAVSRVAARSADEPTSPPITLTTLTWSDLDDWHDAEGSRMSSNTGSTFDSQQSGDSVAHFEIGSDHMNSSMDSVALHAYRDKLYAATASRISVSLGGHAVDLAVAQPVSPPISLSTESWSHLDRDTEENRLPSDTGSTSESQQSEDNSDRIEVGSERTSSSMGSVALRAYWHELHATTVSQTTVWAGGHGVDIAAAQPASPPISLPSLTWSDSDLDHDAEGSRMSSDTGSAFDEGQQSGDSSDRMSIEVGSAHTANSSMDSVTQRAYWDELYATNA